MSMSILPKINYLLTMIPTQPTTNGFQSLDSIKGKFYWKNNRPRIKLVLSGEIFIPILTCVERYQAVVHPITYLGL